MMKSIRVLLLLAVAQILFGSCLLWKESFLSLREGNVYFLILIVGVSGLLCWD
ncbi:conserved domain protein [Streptococcus oralis SK255]|uniref:Conserved domain protein n=1 Tax=Streptococcus oralis SK255 TaxID=1005704 RepID=F5VSM8_STROR|nr:conserved domain protein [Streptococcus oralis SK255]